MLKLLIVFCSLCFFSTANASERQNEVYVVSDNQINDFLRKFIDSSVANVTMLFEFVTKLLRDAMTGSQSQLPINKINEKLYASIRDANT
jgi:hypothetical protein